MTAAQRIDVHHHPSPPSYINSRDNSNRFATPQLQWTVTKTLEDMDRGGGTMPFITEEREAIDRGNAVRPMPRWGRLL